MKHNGLSRRIAQSMMAIALVTTLMVTISSYVFYYLWQKYWPENIPSENLIPSGPEWLWLLSTTLIALIISLLIALKLSRRILIPLNSVIESINLISQGDLTVRVLHCDKSLGEIATLINNFNFLADQLALMTQEQSFWNAAIAHELRTPVTILKGRLQGLADGVFTANEQQFRSLLTQVEGLIRLIEDLRMISLVESGHLELQIQEIDLSNEINILVDLLSDKFQVSGKILKLDLSSDCVQCDPIRIRQALLALLDNALKYSVAGKIYIKTYISGNIYHLSVEDEGPGISPEFASHAFTAFRREKNTKTTGSGLGLAVVASIAKAHRGSASCEQTPQGGTRFEIHWPLKHHNSNKPLISQWSFR